MEPQPAGNGELHKTLSYKQAHDLNEKRKRFFTIFLSQDTTPTVMNFRCFNCGSIIFQYHNVLRGTFEGAIDIKETEKATDHLCKKCNIIYRLV